jgi:phosphoglucosamine mutase
VDDRAAVMQEVGRLAGARYDDVETYDGVRVELDGGWFLVRASGTQPLVRITAEARDDDRATDLFDAAGTLYEEASALVSE